MKRRRDRRTVQKFLAAYAAWQALTNRHPTAFEIAQHLGVRRMWVLRLLRRSRELGWVELRDGALRLTEAGVRACNVEAGVAVLADDCGTCGGFGCLLCDGDGRELVRVTP